MCCLDSVHETQTSTATLFDNSNSNDVQVMVHQVRQVQTGLNESADCFVYDSYTNNTFLFFSNDYNSTVCDSDTHFFFTMICISFSRSVMGCIVSHAPSASK